MPNERSVVRLLAIAGAVLAGIAPLAGSPYANQHASMDVTELARVVSREEDHVTALELAQWIKERRPGLRVIDIRDSEPFATYHIPSAARVSLDSLVRMPFRQDETLVLYSDGGAHAAQGWTFLRALGYRRVFFLRGGLNEWLEMVISPTLPAYPSASEREEVERVSALSRYFAGTPRRDPNARLGREVPHSNGADAGATTGAAIIARMRKRGC